MTDTEPIEVPADDVLERSVARRTPYSVASALGGWVAALVILLGIAAAIYFYGRHATEPSVPAGPAPAREAPVPGPAPDAATRHPIPDALVQSDSQEPLPALDHSDGPLQATLAGLVGPASARDLFRSDEIVRRIVVTIDNLPRKKLPAQLLPVKPTAGPFLTTSENGSAVVAAANEARYAAYVSLATAVDAKALVIARQIAEGLGAAHDRGVVHRDLKPENVLLEAETGRVVLMDFGLARMSELVGHTAEGIAGTPVFLAPEQARGREVDGRADL